MGKRYGRNQRRAARENIARLEADLAKAGETARQANATALAAARRANNALTEALNTILQGSDPRFFHDVIEHLAHEAGRAAGQEFKAQAEAAISRMGDEIEFRMREEIDRGIRDAVYVIRVDIPPISWNVEVPRRCGGYPRPSSHGGARP